MFFHTTILREASKANVALERLLSSVLPHMTSEVTALSESLRAFLTLIRPHPAMTTFVLRQITFLNTAHGTFIAGERLESTVNLVFVKAKLVNFGKHIFTIFAFQALFVVMATHMEYQVVSPLEAFFAQTTSIRPKSRRAGPT